MVIGIVSKFPPKLKKHTEDGALAGYTKNLAFSLPYKEEIVVYADEHGEGESEYFDERVRVKRTWRKGLLYPFAVLAKVFRDRPDVVHVQHEFFLYGGGASSLVFLVLLFGLRLLGVSAVVTVHGVVPLSSINRAFVKENRSVLPAFVVKAGFSFIIKGIARLSKLIIVHEEKFAALIREEYGCADVVCKVVPIGIESKQEKHDEAASKAALGLEGKKVILFFGYITAYKGIELLIDAFKGLDSGHVLIVAGGRHPRLKDYVEGLKEQAQRVAPGRVVFTDFVPEEKIPVYFAASDLVVFPYTIGMASSASMSTAIAFAKPFIVSEAFKDIVDVKEAVFERDPEDLAKKIRGFFGSDGIRSGLVSLSARLRQERSWDSVGELTYGIYREVSATPGRMAAKRKFAKQEP